MRIDVLSATQIENVVFRVADEFECDDDSLRLEINSHELWESLIICVLGSRVRYETAIAAAKRLIERGLGTPDAVANLANPTSKVTDILRSQGSHSAVSNNYPFAVSRAGRIVACANALVSGIWSSEQIFNPDIETSTARRITVTALAGLGPKQASLFLRTIGKSKAIAVLDSHVLRYLRIVGALDGSAPRNIAQYEQMETVFIEYCNLKGIEIEAMDIAIWTTMRVGKREGYL